MMRLTKLNYVAALVCLLLLYQAAMTQPFFINQPKGETANTLYAVDRDTVQFPKIKSAPLPGYPEEAKRNKTEGIVLLKLVLHSSGKVTKVIPLKELPYGLTEAAANAARKIEFEVGRINGKPVSVYYKVGYTFSLSKGVSVNTAPEQ